MSSKPIKLTPVIIDEIREEFMKYLKGGKIQDGKISFNKNLSSTERKATVFFTETAWNKMQALIREFDKEVAWHSIASRIGDDLSKDEYLISDILVYPQEVTGATVTTDQQKYQNWLMQHDDETYNNIRCQGHSHVNMAVVPSGVDLQFYESILSQLNDDMFYIFMIWNKKGDRTIKIYDLAKNILFDNSCEVKVLKNSETLDFTFEGCSDEEKAAAVKAVMDLRNKKKTDSFIIEAKKLVESEANKYIKEARKFVESEVSKSKKANNDVSDNIDKAFKDVYKNTKYKGRRDLATEHRGFGYGYEDYGYSYYGDFYR